MSTDNYGYHDFILDCGWDFGCIEATVERGVSETDIKLLAESEHGLTPEGLLEYCRVRLLDAAEVRLRAAGFEASGASNAERIILSVKSAGDDEEAAVEALDDLRAIVGPLFSVEYDGEGNTDNFGQSTDDVRVEVKPSP